MEGAVLIIPTLAKLYEVIASAVDPGGVDLEVEVAVTGLQLHMSVLIQLYIYTGTYMLALIS